MVIEFSKLILNFGLIAAMLITPSFILMAHWYRKQLPNPLMVWKKPELVIITIFFSVITLILFIVGLSSFFTHYGYLESTQIDASTRERFLTIGFACFLFNISLIFVYLAIRTLLVQVVIDQGIVINDRYLRIPDFRNMIKWYEISDYYVKSDYPNVVFTLILQREPMRFERKTLRVPVYCRDEFEALLEQKMNSVSSGQSQSETSKRKFSEN